MMLSQGTPEDERLDLGAEPYWMQDIRIAQRAIEALRRGSGIDGRSNQDCDLSEEGESA
jgi:hypothetical protein